MPEYSSKQTAGDLVVSAQLDTTANTITYTITGPNGLTTTATQQAPAESTQYPFYPAKPSTATVRTLLGPFREAGIALGSAIDSLTNVTTYVNREASNAAAAATATNKPVPDAPAPPPSTNNAADPAVAPAPNNTPPVQSTSPPAAVTTSSDPTVGRTLGGANIDSPAPATVTDPTVGRTLGGANIDSPAPAAVTDPTVGRTLGGAHVDNPSPAAVTDDPTVGRTLGGAHVDNPAPKATGIDEDSAYPPNPVDVAAAAKLAEGVGRTAPGDALRGLTVPKLDAQSQKTQQDAANTAAADDWRVRLSLAKGATYLYKNKGKEGILLPLAATDGVIFPYTPAIQVQYVASYDPTEVTHSNYKFFSYRGSAVDQISITCEFTAQDTKEAEYLLAVIHFFRSVTKMFYGKDQNPKNGTPPPLCYLTGLGTYQFDNHPLAITGFTYSLPTDVDYIRAQSASPPPGVSTAPSNVPSSNSNSVSGNRAQVAGLSPGALANPPVFDSTKAQKNKPTYVPTKISITITAVPIVTRNDISNNFSLEEYGTGALLRGKQRKSGGGIW